jgi:hypothetical protein
MGAHGAHESKGGSLTAAGVSSDLTARAGSPVLCWAVENSRLKRAKCRPMSAVADVQAIRMSMILSCCSRRRRSCEVVMPALVDAPREEGRQAGPLTRRASR